LREERRRERGTEEGGPVGEGREEERVTGWNETDFESGVGGATGGGIVESDMGGSWCAGIGRGGVGGRRRRFGFCERIDFGDGIRDGWTGEV
jgi:hypothetical protein